MDIWGLHTPENIIFEQVGEAELLWEVFCYLRNVSFKFRKYCLQEIPEFK